ncbi:hypothetical protein ES707_13820 [subsurface metagenome]
MLCTMPATWSARSAPFTARSEPTAFRLDCQGASAATTVETVCGGLANAPIAFLIIISLKVWNP